jgi:hypothetical protein
MRIFKNRAPRKLFRPKQEEVTEWRENGTLRFVLVRCNLGDELSGAVAHMKEEKNSYRIFVWKLDRRRRLGIPRCRWQGNTKMGSEEI